MDLMLYNTLSRSKEKFIPLEPGKAGMYVCGPTVYDYAHIGNLRSYIFADLLRRVLEYNGYEVTHVMNITDVGHLVSDADEGEDKMAESARREKDALGTGGIYTGFHEQHGVAQPQETHHSVQSHRPYPGDDRVYPGAFGKRLCLPH